MGNDNAVLALLIDHIEDGTFAGPRVTRSGYIEGKSPFSANNGILVDSEKAALDAVRAVATRDFSRSSSTTRSAGRGGRRRPPARHASWPCRHSNADG
jgi:hypothetical protein